MTSPLLSNGVLMVPLHVVIPQGEHLWSPQACHISNEGRECPVPPSHLVSVLRDCGHGDRQVHRFCHDHLSAVLALPFTCACGASARLTEPVAL